MADDEIMEVFEPCVSYDPVGYPLLVLVSSGEITAMVWM